MQTRLNPEDKNFDYSRPLAVVGNGSLACSIVSGLLKAGCAVNLCTDYVQEAAGLVYRSFSRSGEDRKCKDGSGLNIVEHLKDIGKPLLAIVITEEDLSTKRNVIRELEGLLEPDSCICINTESIGLGEIQNGFAYADRIIGLNWSEPAHTTRFLEIIINDRVADKPRSTVNKLALLLNKDAYTVTDSGVRSRLMSAMIREAFYLVENGYASLEDIDRACRNDAGYYLPFAGNFRYMDLMGTYAYGIVMKDLNPELAKETELPDFFKNIIDNDGRGMENGKGLYQYSKGEIKIWKTVFHEFSHRIAEIINKYPFNYKEKSIE